MKAKLTKEEKQILNSYEKGEFKPVPESERLENLAILRAARRKNAVICIRMNDADLESLRERAEKNGVPYQTLISSVLHRYVNDDFIDRKEFEKTKKLLAA